MLNILNDLSPFNHACLIGFATVFFMPFIFGSHFSDYQGVTPFTQSMTAASGRIRLLNDSVMLYFIFVFILVFLAYLFKGLSDKVVMEFKQAARPHRRKNRETDNPQRTIFFTACFLMFINFSWVWAFTFSSIGKSRIISSILSGSEFFIAVYILSGFLANLYLFVYALLMMEARKHIVFIENSSAAP